MNSDIKIRKVNQTDATKWFKFVNKEKNFNKKIFNDNRNIALVAEYKG